MSTENSILYLSIALVSLLIIAFLLGRLFPSIFNKKDDSLEDNSAH